MNDDQDSAAVELPEQEIPSLLTGQKALVTGGNSGIGRAVAIALAAAGADVVVNYYDDEEAAGAVTGEIRDTGSAAEMFQADVAEEAAVKELFAFTLEQFGTLDILVNNAGIQMDAPFDEMSLSQWQRVLDVNLTGQFLCAREAVKEFKRRGVVKETSCAAGKIICMSSVHETIPWAGHVNYAASKGGVMLLMKSLAQEVAAHRIRVNSIAPGAIRTPINRQTWQDEAAHKKLMELIPYNRIGEPGDIARIAVWLASDQSDYITGTTITADGGMTLYPGFTEGG
jgi:glucose 1-dehydrogenase